MAKTSPGEARRSTNHRVDQLRTALIAIERATGKSISEIALKYNVSTAVVHRELSTAEESGLIDAFRGVAYERLMGPALAVYDARLAIGDLDAARDVVFGLGVFAKSGDGGRRQRRAVETLDAYRSSRKSLDGAVRPTRLEEADDVGIDDGPDGTSAV